MKTKILLLVTLLIVLVGVVSAGEVSNETVSTDISDEGTAIQDTVTATTDVQKSVNEKNKVLKEDNNLKASSKIYDVSNFNSLHSALTSNTYDTVTVNVKSNIVLTSDTTLNKAIKTLTINGNGKIINGNDKYSFLIINSSTVNLNNIKITNCYADECGGAIQNYGILNIKNSILNDNNAGDYGGAIFNDNAKLTIINSTFNNNIVNYGGGAIYNINSITNIRNTTLKNNFAPDGGAIFNEYEAYLNITDSILIDNTAYAGGAIFNDYKGYLNIKNTTLNNNMAEVGGGAIYNIDYGYLNITKSTLNNNYATFDGGAIYNGEKGYLKISNSTINNNTATNYGGAIYNEANITITQSALNNNILTIVDDQDVDYGGVIYNKANITIIKSTLNNNYVFYVKGVIYNYQGNIIIMDSTFNYNHAGYGGAIYNEKGTFTITNTTLNNNTANYGGAIYNDKGTFTITNTTLNNNTGEYGGAVYNVGILSITNTTLNNNIGEYGGAVYNVGTLTIINTILNNNTAIWHLNSHFSVGPIESFDGYGGAIYNEGNLTITKTTLNNNMVSNGGNGGDGYGGAIYNEGNLTITKTTLNNNQVSNWGTYGDCWGGAIYSLGNNTIIKDNVFVANKANMTGKTIINDGKATILNNTNSETSKYSGTIYTNGTNVQIKNNIFYDVNVFINSMNVLNSKYVLTTKVSDGTSNKLNIGRVSYTLDGKWIGSINVTNGSSWISFNVPRIGNHTIVATYINPNGDSITSDTYKFEKKANVNALFNAYNVKNGKVIVVTTVKDDKGNNINSGRVSYSLNGKWIGSIDVKNGSSWISFNYNDSVVTFKATYITDSNVNQNIYTRTLNLNELKAFASQKSSNQNTDTQPVKNSSVHIMINSMNLLNGKYVITTKITDDKYVKLSVGRVSYTLDGKWIGSINVVNGSSWILFNALNLGNHSIVATYIDVSGKYITADTYSFVKQSSVSGVNSLFNQYNVKNGKVIIVTAVKNDKGNPINSGRISYSVNGKWVGSVDVKNGSSWISFNYTDSVVTFKATFITNSGVTQNIYTRTLDLDEIAKLKQV